MLDDSARILVADDERPVRDALERALRLEGYDVETVADGGEAMVAATGRTHDALLLDLTMPEVDGVEVCRRLRDRGVSIPILVVTARDAISDRVAGLDAGADDYLVKPFAVPELLARLRALLRRAAPGPTGAPLAYRDLTLDPASRLVHRGDRVLDLTRTEFSLLELFVRHPGQVLTRRAIYESVWGYDFGPSSNSLDVYIGYLRRKLEAGGEERLIQTVRGVGYVLRTA